MSDSAPKRRRRVRGPQTSYLRPDIERCQENLAQLTTEVENLGQVNAVLRLRLDSCQLNIAEAERKIVQQAASRCSLSSATQRLLRDEVRNQASVVALPPPELWSPEFNQRLGSLSRDEVRFMLMNGYRDAYALLQAALRNRLLMPQVELAVRKGCAFAKCQTTLNPTVWGSVRGTNLVTGDDDVPKDWYTSVALGVPLPLLPPLFRLQVQVALKTYNANVSYLMHRRAALQQELADLTPLTMDPQHLSNQSIAKKQTSIPRICQEQSSAGMHDVITHTDAILEQLEQTFKDELQAVFHLAQDAASAIPAEVMAYMVGTCLPFHLDMHQTVSALFARLEPEFKISQQQQPQQQLALITGGRNLVNVALTGYSIPAFRMAA